MCLVNLRGRELDPDLALSAATRRLDGDLPDRFPRRHPDLHDGTAE